MGRSVLEVMADTGHTYMLGLVVQVQSKRDESWLPVLVSCCKIIYTAAYLTCLRFS